jgi:hypothetical protein
MAALLAGCPIWEGTQQWNLSFPRRPDSLTGADLNEVPLRADRGNEIRLWRHDDGRFWDHDLGHHGDSRDNDKRHHRHFFNDFVWLRSVFLIGGTPATDTSTADIPTTDIPTRMRITIPHRLTVTNIGKIWR